MVKARFTARGGVFTGFRVAGHASFDQCGRDIACAAVTSAVELTANTITEILGTEAIVDVKPACVTLELPDRPAPHDAAEALLRGLHLHLTLLAEQFPDSVTVEKLEV